MCFSNRLAIHKVIIKVQHSFVIQELVEQLQHFKTFMFHTVMQRDLKEYYNYSAENSSPFSTVKEF